MEEPSPIMALLTNRQAKPEVKVVINAGQFATSPPQYWHRIEMSDDAQFNINFWVEEESQAKTGCFT
ncbi:hypothetical protein DMH17_14435 [Raoultella planticola]|nr:hypothetical protein [Raoultella planticola]